MFRNLTPKEIASAFTMPAILNKEHFIVSDFISKEIITIQFSDSYKQTFVQCLYYSIEGTPSIFYYRSNFFEQNRLKKRHSINFLNSYRRKHPEFSFFFVLKMLYDSRIIRK